MPKSLLCAFRLGLVLAGMVAAGPAGGEEYSYADRHPEVVAELKAEIALARERFAPLRTHAPDATFPE